MSNAFSSAHIISVLLKHGFIEVSQKGSHRKYRYKTYTVIVPHPRKDIPFGTFNSIVRQSGLKKADFLDG